MNWTKIWPKLSYWAKWAVVILLAAALKLFYSSAGVDQLRWVLSPTALLVELATGVSFYYEDHIGYMSVDRTFLIAGSCSGVNFMIAAFMLIAIGKLWRSRPSEPGWLFIVISSIKAYAATIVANTVRIAGAMQLRDNAPAIPWIDADELHRLEGIVVYFAALLIIHFLDDRAERGDKDRPFLRKCIWPLTVYYAVALGIPLLNGAYGRHPELWHHAEVVLVAPSLLVLALYAITLVKRRARDGRRLAKAADRPTH